MIMDVNTCPVCGKGKLVRKVLKESFEYKGKTTIIPHYVVHACDKCGEEIVDKKTLAKSGRILNEFKRSVEGLLSGSEIKAIRKKLGLTQEEMARILGGGAKGFARYEAGTVCHSKAMDTLLRLLGSFPYLILFVQEKACYVVPDKKKCLPARPENVSKIRSEEPCYAIPEGLMLSSIDKPYTLEFRSHLG